MVISGASLIVLLLIAAVCGAIGRGLAGGTRGGLLTSIALGFVGALAGTWIGRELRLPDPLLIHVGGRSFPIIWSIVGAALIVMLLHLLTRRRSWLRI